MDNEQEAARIHAALQQLTIAKNIALREVLENQVTIMAALKNADRTKIAEEVYELAAQNLAKIEALSKNEAAEITGLSFPNQN